MHSNLYDLIRDISDSQNFDDLRSAERGIPSDDLNQKTQLQRHLCASLTIDERNDVEFYDAKESMLRIAWAYDGLVAAEW